MAYPLESENVTVPSMDVFLETERLILRRFTPADADRLVELDSDPAVMRYVNGGTPTPRQEIETEILPAFLGYYQRFAGYGFWAVIEKSSREFIGWFCFRPEPGAPVTEPELGYRLRSTAWEKGYATEGACALIDKGFAEFGVERVVAGALAANTRSRRVMEKSGLTLARTFAYQSEEENAVGYALDKADWERRRPVQ